MWTHLAFNLFILLLVLGNLAPSTAESEPNNEVSNEIYKPELSEDIEFLPGPRIVGGRNAAQAQFPYQVSLRLRNSHICGGAIISRNYIITAAHCVVDERTNARYSPSLLSIRAGSNSVNSGGSILRVAEVKPHPNYRNLINDIAVLRLSSPVTLNDRINVIPLTTTEVPSGSPVVISGWGRLRGGGPIPIQLQYNTLTALSTNECSRRIRNAPSSILCLAHSSGNGACQGDSGGPGVFNGRLVGVTNFVIGTCGTNAPDGYAKISYFNSWIRSNTDL